MDKKPRKEHGTPKDKASELPERTRSGPILPRKGGGPPLRGGKRSWARLREEVESAARTERSEDGPGIQGAFARAAMEVVQRRVMEKPKPRRLRRVVTHAHVFEELAPAQSFDVEGILRGLREMFRLSLDKLPICSWSKRVNLRRLSYDFVSGLSVGVLLVPQAMAYALLVGVPPIHGLYSSLLPIWTHALLTSSPKLSPGPAGPASILTGQIVTSLEPEDEADRLRLVTALSLLTGLVLLAAGFFRLGFIANVLSWPVMSGFSTAAGIITAISQFPNMAGVEAPPQATAVGDLVVFLERIHTTNLPTLYLGLAVLFCLVGWKKLHMCYLWPCSKNKSGPPAWIPAQFASVVVSIVVAQQMELEKYGVRLVGHVEEGFPPLEIPRMSLDELSTLLPQACILGIVAYVGAITLALTFGGGRHSNPVMPSLELGALGAASVAAGVSSGWVPSASFTRSAVMDQLGARTPIASMLTGVVVLIVVMAAGPFVAMLPRATLAAMVISSVGRLLKFHDAATMWRTKPADFVQFLSTFLLTLVLGIQTGILASVGISMATLLSRSFNPRITELWRLPGTDHFVDSQRYPAARPVRGVIVLRADGELNFGSVRAMIEAVRHVISTIQTRREEVELAKRILRLGHFSDSTLSMARQGSADTYTADRYSDNTAKSSHRPKKSTSASAKYIPPALPPTNVTSSSAAATATASNKERKHDPADDSDTFSMSRYLTRPSQLEEEERRLKKKRLDQNHVFSGGSGLSANDKKLFSGGGGQGRGRGGGNDQKVFSGGGGRGRGGGRGGGKDQNVPSSSTLAMRVMAPEASEDVREMRRMAGHESKSGDETDEEDGFSDFSDLDRNQGDNDGGAADSRLMHEKREQDRAAKAAATAHGYESSMTNASSVDRHRTGVPRQVSFRPGSDNDTDNFTLRASPHSHTHTHAHPPHAKSHGQAHVASAGEDSGTDKGAGAIGKSASGLMYRGSRRQRDDLRGLDRRDQAAVDAREARHWARVGAVMEEYARPPPPMDPRLVEHLGPGPAGRPWSQDPLSIHAVIIDGSRIPSVDTSACNDLLAEVRDFRKQGLHLLLAGFPGPVRDTLERFGVLSERHVPLFYLSIMAAIQAAAGDPTQNVDDPDLAGTGYNTDHDTHRPNPSPAPPETPKPQPSKTSSKPSKKSSSKSTSKKRSKHDDNDDDNDQNGHETKKPSKQASSFSAPRPQKTASLFAPERPSTIEEDSIPEPPKPVRTEPIKYHPDRESSAVYPAKTITDVLESSLRDIEEFDLPGANPSTSPKPHHH